MKKHYLAVLASAALLAACGGGGGDGQPAPGPVDTPAQAEVEVTGVAAKGLITGAIVTAHLVDANGAVQSQAAATADAPTDAQGRYRIRVRGTGANPVVIRVVAPAGGATHRDEVTGQTQTLPPGFSIRAAVVPRAAATLTVNVTPFTEMATEAAEDQGLTETNVLQANNTVKLMLGLGEGDLNTVPVKNTTDAATPDEQRLAVMLTAVSQMAASGALGCTGDAGARAQCVVEGLSNAVTAPNSFALSGGAGAALVDAIRTVVQNPALVGNVPPSIVAAAIAALQCQGVTCTAPAPSAPLDAAGAIAATKTLFTDLKSDIVTMFGDRNSVIRGEIEVQNDKFGEAMRHAQAPAELTAKSTALLLMGVDLYNDYKAGRTTQVTRLRGQNTGFSSDGWRTFPVYAGGCSLYQDSGATQLATAIANARYIGCSTRYYYAWATSTEYSHGFTLTPSSTTGTFTYLNRARTRKSGVNTNLAPAAGAASGTLVTTVDANGRITSFGASGTLAGAFAAGGTALVSDSHAWDVSGTRSIDASNPKLSTVTMAGSVVAKDASGAVLGTLQLKTASFSEIPVSRDANGNIVASTHPGAVTTAGGELSAGSLSLTWTTPAAEFEASISATDSAWDKSMTTHMPTRVAVEGRLALIDSGVKTDYLTGRMNAAMTGFEQYSALAEMSPTNNVTINATLAATVTAPGRPLLALDIGTTWRNDENEPRTVSIGYRSYNGGTPRSAVQVDVRRTTTTGPAAVTITDTTNNISVSGAQHATSADVMLRGTTKIGELNPSTGVLTFSDGSFVSAGF